MAIVMQQWGSPHGPLPHDGWYLKSFDFEAFKGRGAITLTPDIAKAKRFADIVEAHAFWKTIPTCKPFREDGRPNRPLTAANWRFEPIPN